MTGQNRRVLQAPPAHAFAYQLFQAYESHQPGKEGGCMGMPIFANRYPDETAIPAEPSWLAFGEPHQAVRVYDPFFHNCVLGENGAGEIFAATFMPYANTYIFVGSSGLTRLATLTADLDMGDSASASIFVEDENGDEVGGLDITVYHHQSRGDTIPNGSAIIVSYQPMARKWFTDAFQPEP